MSTVGADDLLNRPLREVHKLLKPPPLVEVINSVSQSLNRKKHTSDKINTKIDGISG